MPIDPKLQTSLSALIALAIKSDLTREELADSLLATAVVVMNDCTTEKDISNNEWLRNQLEGNLAFLSPNYKGAN